MGVSRFWWFPDGSTDPRSISLGEIVQERVGPDILYRQEVVEGYTGTQSQVMLGGRMRIRLKHTWTRDAGGVGDTRRRELRNLIGWLMRGGSCVFVEDDDFAFAAFCQTSPTQGAFTVASDVNLFQVLKGSADVEDREVWIQSDPSVYLFEHKLCTLHQFTRGKLTLSTAVHLDYRDMEWALVREYGCYPALRLPKEFRSSVDALLHDREWIFRLDLPLEEDPDGLLALYTAGIPIGAPDDYWQHTQTDPIEEVPWPR